MSVFPDLDLEHGFLRIAPRVWVVLGSSIALLGSSYIATLRWARGALVERLERRGFAVDVGDVGFRPLALRVSDLRASHRSGLLTVELPQIRVEVGLAGIERVRVQGGEVDLKGDINEVREALLADKTPPSLAPEPSRPSLPVVVEDVALRWQGPLGSGSSLTVLGLSLERGEGLLDVRLAALDARSEGALGHFERVIARVAEKDLGIATLQVGSGEASLDLSNVRRMYGSAASTNVPAGTSASGTQPASKNPLLGMFELAPARGGELRRVVQQGAGILARRLPEAGNLNLSQMVLSVRAGDQMLTIGPGSLYARRENDKVQFGFSSRASQGNTALDMHVVAPLGDGPVEARVQGGPVPLATLGIKPGNFGLQEVEQTQLTLDAQVTLSADGARADFSTLGDVRGLALQQERLAPHALTNIDLGWSVSGYVVLDGSDIAVKAGHLKLGKVNAVADLHLQRGADRLKLDADFRVDEGSCQDMFEALPQGAVPLLAGARLDGTFSWHGGIRIDTDHLGSTKAKWNMRNHCRFQNVPEDAEPSQFRETFSLHVPDYDGQPMVVRTGPGSAAWASLEEVSPFMEVAVLTTEDGGFWGHHGFDSSAIEAAIRRNLERGQFSRGASTISMQLAKNLYLERDKYIARKVQEALLTMLLEQELRKREILELYLNVIEYGPGVYGIRNAARHYFAASPNELSLAQCFFLASVLPRPKAQHFDEGGRLVPLRASLVRNLMKIAHERGRLSAEDLQRGLEEELRFGVPSLDTNPYDTREGELPSGPFPDGEPEDDAH